MSHTPGPWSANGPTEGHYAGDVVQVWSIVPDHQADVDGAEIATVYHNAVSVDSESETAANARLIAAAPELLAALKEVRAWAHSTRALAALGGGK